MLMCFALRGCCAGNVKEFGFWEVNAATLQDISEAPPPQQDGMASAASLGSSPSLPHPNALEPVPAAAEQVGGAPFFRKVAYL